MSFEELKNMDCSSIPISNLIAMIARGQSIYMNSRLGDLGINETQMHFLFEISHHDNLNQERIATRCNINKGAVARSIRKLEETLSKAIKILKEWEDEIIMEKGYVDKELLQLVLKEIAIKTMELNEKGE